MRDDDDFFCVKMRASASGVHVSGAERVVLRDAVPAAAAALAGRALLHPRGTPDDIRVRVEKAGKTLHVPALPVIPEHTATAAEGLARVAELLSQDGISRVPEIMKLFRETASMRGAMLLRADTLERLEPDKERGVRATRMDAAGNSAVAASAERGKNHFREALVLASKVQAAPGIVAEICVSDDPDYVTGYVASKTLGYRRIETIKDKGDSAGGRIFLFRGPDCLVRKCIDFLENQTVLVDGVAESPPSSATAAAPVKPLESLAEELDEIGKAGLGRKCRQCDGATGPHAQLDGRDVLVLSSNDYCDLARDPRVVEAAAQAARRWGAGTGGARLTTGTQPPHSALEHHLAAFKGTEDAIVFSTGYMANLGVISALCGPGDVILSDALNHASIIDGCRLSRALVKVYPHRDMDALAALVAEFRGRARRVLAVSDAVFSMDGDVLDAPRFIDICRAGGVLSMIDEAHSTGVLGATGRGICEHFGCQHPDIAVGTLSKALGSVGGYAAASRVVVDYLRNKARSFIFSTSLPASAMAAADAALCVLEQEPWRASAVRENAKALVSALAARGIRASTGSAIVPIVVGDEKAAMCASAALLDEGIWLPAIRYPTVARGAARLRASVMSAHSVADIERAAEAIARALKSKGR